jgi:hypothetical protein
VGKGDDVLERVVFEDVEVALLEILGQVAILIDNGAGQEDLVDIATKGVDAVVALDFLVGDGVRGAYGGVVGRIRRDDGVMVDIERRLGFGLLRGWHDGGHGGCGCLRGGGLRGGVW